MTTPKDGVTAMQAPSELWKATDALLNALTAYEIAQQGQSDQLQRFAAGLVAAKRRAGEALNAHGVQECFPLLDPNVPEGGSRYPDKGCYRVGCPIHGGPGGVPKVQAALPVDRLEQVIDTYLEDYEMVGEAKDGRDACHQPTDDERALIKDAILGLLANEEWDAEWGKLIEQRAAARGVMASDDAQQVDDADAVSRAADEFDGIATDYDNQGNNSEAESARARAYELRQVLSRMVRALGVKGPDHG